MNDTFMRILILRYFHFKLYIGRSNFTNVCKFIIVMHLVSC